MSEDDIELKNLILEKLSAGGILNDLKAQIRAAVLHTLSQEKQSKMPTIEQQKHIRQFIENTEGRLAISLVKDFLEKMNLNHTLSLLELELGLAVTDLKDRNSIIEDYHDMIPDSKSEDPLIINFIGTILNSQNDNFVNVMFNESKNNCEITKTGRVLSQLSDPIEFKSEDISELSDAVELLDTTPRQNKDINHVVISPYQAPQKRNSIGSGIDENYDDSFVERSSTTKRNESNADDSIKEVDLEEIDYQSDDRSCNDETVNSGRSLSLDYVEDAKHNH